MARSSQRGKYAGAPVIVLGMHRSGTTMVIELLDRLGLFVGRELESNHEALYFLELNDELFRRCNATWDQPQPMARFFEHRDAVELTRACVASDLRSKNFRKFVGWKRALKSGGVEGFDEPWGFKDPRTVFTLRLWLELFPKAKLIHVWRNGIDVANSLWTREKKRLAHEREVFERRLERRSPEEHVARAAYKGSTRCLSFEGAFTLWEEYVAEADARLARLDRPILAVRYEDFVAAPERPLRDLASFCELESFEESDFQTALAEVDASRGNAFRSGAELAPHVLRALESPWMKKLGYADAPATVRA